MSILDRKLLRDLKGSKGSLAGILGIIAIGIACFVSMTSSYFNLEGARSRYYAVSRMADFWIELKKMPITELRQLREIPGVAELHGRITFQLTVDLAGEPKPLMGQVISLPDSRRPAPNDIVMMQGSYFSRDRKDEVIVNDAFAKARNLEPGDRIHVLLNNRRQELTVVGTAISAEFVYLIGPGSIVPDPMNYGLFYMPHQHCEEIFDFNGACNQLVGKLDPRFQHRPEIVLQRFEELLEPYGVAAVTPREQFPSHRFVTDEIFGLRVSATILPSIFLSVAALVLNVLMTRLAQQQRTVVGTLKAIGYSNVQMTVHFLKFGVFVGLLGSLIGCVLGYLLAEGMVVMYRQFFQFPNLVNRLYPGIWLIGVAIGVFFCVVGTLRGVHTVMRLNPAESMRPEAPSTARGIFIERFGWLWNQLGFRWHMVLRDLFRQRGRSLAGIFAAAMGSALLMLTFWSRESIQYLIDFQFDKLLLSDYELSFKDPLQYPVLFEAERLPGVKRAEPVLNIACKLKNGVWEKKLAVQGIRRGAELTVPRDTRGNAVPIPESGLLLTRALADILHVQPGQTLVFQPTQGNREAKVVPVSQVVDGYLGLSAYASFDYLNRLVDEGAAVSTVQLQVATLAEPPEGFYRELKVLPALQAVTAVRDDKANLENTVVEQMKFSITILVLFSGVIFFGSILNSSLIALSERKREVATFRVVGYGPWEVGMIFLRESLVINLLGTLIGIPLGLYLNVQLAELYATELFRMPVVFSPETIVWTAGLAVVFTLSAHAVVQRSIHFMDWREALNVKE